MIGAFGVAAVDRVAALGRFFVALKLLMPLGRITETDAGVAMDFLAFAVEDQCAVAFVDKDFVGLDQRLGLLGLAGGASGESDHSGQRDYAEKSISLAPNLTKLTPRHAQK